MLNNTDLIEIVKRRTKTSLGKEGWSTCLNQEFETNSVFSNYKAF